MDEFNYETVRDAIPRMLEMVADIPSFEAWLAKYKVDRDFLFAGGLAIAELEMPANVAFYLGVCVAWEVAKT